MDSAVGLISLQALASCWHDGLASCLCVDVNLSLLVVSSYIFTYLHLKDHPGGQAREAKGGRTTRVIAKRDYQRKHTPWQESNLPASDLPEQMDVL